MMETNSPVVTITDEILNELERASKFTNRFMVEVQPGSLQALLSERAELKRMNAITMQALKRLASVPGCGCSYPCRCGGEEWTRAELEGRMDFAQSAIDKAMQERQE